MAADTRDDPARDPFDVDGAVESHLQRGVARDEGRDPREATDVVCLLDGHEPQSAVDCHRNEVVAAPQVRGLSRAVEQPACVEVDERVAREAREEVHGLAQRAHHGVADAAGAVLHGRARGHQRRDVRADGDVGCGRCDRRGRDERPRAGHDRDDVAGYLGRAEVGRVLVELDDDRTRVTGRRMTPSGVPPERERAPPPDAHDHGDVGTQPGREELRHRREPHREQLDLAARTSASASAYPPSMVTPAPTGRSASHGGAGSGMNPKSSDQSPSTPASPATCCGARVDAPGPSAYAMTWDKRESVGSKNGSEAGILPSP